MLTYAIGLAAALMWLALELYWHAQRMEARFHGVDERAKQSHGYLKGQLPRGSINVRKTVVVDYDKGIDLGEDWEDDFQATQAFPESGESGMRPKVR